MGRLLPEDIRGQIQWFQSHVEAWEANAAEIGLTEAQVAAFTDLVDEARDAYFKAEEARVASMAATLTRNQLVEKMCSVGSGLVTTIRGKAESDLNPSVYSKALIPPPPSPTPSGPPPQPKGLAVYFDNGGYVNLSWKGSTRYNTYFTVWRKQPGETHLTLIGTVGAKKWVDKTIVAGVPSAIYCVKAHRGTEESTSSMQINVIFGSIAMAA